MSSETAIRSAALLRVAIVDHMTTCPQVVLRVDTERNRVLCTVCGGVVLAGGRWQ
jgi:hypothetical protein